MGDTRHSVWPVFDGMPSMRAVAGWATSSGEGKPLTHEKRLNLINAYGPPRTLHDIQMQDYADQMTRLQLLDRDCYITLDTSNGTFMLKVMQWSTWEPPFNTPGRHFTIEAAATYTGPGGIMIPHQGWWRLFSKDDVLIRAGQLSGPGSYHLISGDSFQLNLDFEVAWA